MWEHGWALNKKCRKKQCTKSTILYNLVYVKYSEQVICRTSKFIGACPVQEGGRDKENRECCKTMGMGLILNDKNVLESDDGSTIPWI